MGTWQSPASPAPAAAPAHAAGPEEPPVVVGVASPSGAGKTTLSSGLADSLRQRGRTAEHWECDGYFVPRQMPAEDIPKFRAYTGARNWETPVGIDFPRMLGDMKAWRADAPPGAVLILDSYLLFHSYKVTKECDVRLWIQADCETAMLRRWARMTMGTDPKECPEDYHQYREWYEGRVWRCHEEYRGAQLRNASTVPHADGREPMVLRLDGREPAQDVLHSALRHVIGRNHAPPAAG